MSLRRPPLPALRPFVELVWASELPPPVRPVPRRERVLPTGALHPVFRLGETPLRLFRDLDDAVGEAVGCALVGGARASPYLKDLSRPEPSVGALLRPGAAAALLGVPAAPLSHTHTPLGLLWGEAAVEDLRGRLAEAPTAAARLALFERLLLARLAPRRGLDPLVAEALTGLHRLRPVARVAREAGVSQRHLARVFGEAVGLTPRTWGRMLRFGRTLERLSADPALPLADLAAAEGFADQAHLTREFRDLAGLTPGAYRRAAPRESRHVPI
ncbi:AraC-type DNA-binding protein [Tistlia consotensis]|uniref:AraC-type DNA-binding protein n=1 Tax=Tistlia consotensis USBA 355 TaxID=560819 RepID=A0A1Y6BVV5_9PROT|nr:helix-turn-helix domain-containing protein [Tistlia consotensis]SMF23584.1 AraC-type DNA-binding protein [Tistlia consotensis USBA 355]SNR61474.1 AraC-type DNA-binding protein [Tistlia consotensis]